MDPRQLSRAAPRTGEVPLWFHPHDLSQRHLLWLWITATPSRLTIVLFNHNVFGWVALAAAALKLFRPLASADAAAKLCSTLGRFRLTCQPTIFAGRHLTLD